MLKHTHSPHTHCNKKHSGYAIKHGVMCQKLIYYTLKDFLRDNPMLYTEVNTHLGLINECAAK